MGITVEELKLLLSGDATSAKQAIGEVVAANEALIESSAATNAVLGDVSAVSGVATAATVASSSMAAAGLATQEFAAASSVATAAQVEQAASLGVLSGNYGAVIFQEEAAITATEGVVIAEEAATVATTAFGLSISTLMGGIGLLVIGVQFAVNQFVEWREANDKAALAAETAAAKQEVINRALALGAQAGIDYAGAVKLVTERERERMAQIPDQAAADYLRGLSERARAGIAAAAAENALTEGLARQGVVIGEVTDAQKLFTQQERDSEKAARERAAAVQRETAANERFRESVKSLTTDAIGASRGLGMIGQLMPALTGNADELSNVLDGLNENGTLVSRTFGDEMAKRLQKTGDATGGLRNEFDKLRSSTKTFADFMERDFSKILISSFTGGGDAGKGIGAGISSFLTGPNGVIGKAIAGVGGNLGKVLGSVVPGLGTLLGGLAGGAIGKLLGGLFSNPEKQINPIRESFVQAAGGLDALNKKAHDAGLTLDRLLNAKNPQQYKAAIDDLNAAFDKHAQAEDKAEQAAQDLGLTIDQLGPKWAAQKLVEQGGDLFERWSLLNAKGADMNVVTDKMSASINTFFQNAKRTGTEIPEAWRPMLQRMIDMGLLVDENGDKIETLDDAGVSFAKSMSDSVRTVVDAVKALVDAITGKLNPAIASVPRTVDIAFRRHEDGAETTPIDTPSFDHRTMERVTRSGLALLHPGDLVGVPRAGMFGHGGMSVVVNVEGSIRSEDDLVDLIHGRISQLLRDRTPQGVW